MRYPVRLRMAGGESEANRRIGGRVLRWRAARRRAGRKPPWSPRASLVIIGYAAGTALALRMAGFNLGNIVAMTIGLGLAMLVERDDLHRDQVFTMIAVLSVYWVILGAQASAVGLAIVLVVVGAASLVLYREAVRAGVHWADRATADDGDGTP